MWYWICLITVLACLSWLYLGHYLAKRRRRLETEEIIRNYCESEADQRAAVMRACIEVHGDNGVAWFLYGCACLQQRRIMDAARAFGTAYHRDCNLESAALLTFACLKASEGATSDIPEHVLATWNEMKRPDVRHRHEERQVMDVLKSKEPEPGELSALGLLLWRTSGRAYQQRIKTLLESGDPRWAPLWV